MDPVEEKASLEEFLQSLKDEPFLLVARTANGSRLLLSGGDDRVATSLMIAALADDLEMLLKALKKDEN